MKLPAIITRRFRRNPAPPRRAVQTTLKAATATARRGELDDYDSAEPTTSLSAAFIIVFLLHVVAVIGIYIFNHIKATRPTTPAAISASAKTKAAPKLAPSKAAAPESVSKPAPVAQTHREAAAPKLLPSGARIHRVQSGENLTKIATTYAITVADLEEANHLAPNATIKVDQVLNIPAVRNVVRQPSAPTPKTESPKTVLQPIALKAAAPSKPPAAKPTATKPAAKVEPKIYTVDKGDTITYIAKRFGVSGAELIKLNGISEPNKLQPGRKLRIPVKN